MRPMPQMIKQIKSNVPISLIIVIIILIIVVAIVETLIGRESLAFHTIASAIGRTVTNPFQLEII
jgi:hypothetical protein